MGVTYRPLEMSLDEYLALGSGGKRKVALGHFARNSDWAAQFNGDGYIVFSAKSGKVYSKGNDLMDFPKAKDLDKIAGEIGEVVFALSRKVIN